MSVASISLAPMLSTLFFLTISGLALTAMWLAVPLLWKRHAPLVVAGSVALVAFFLVLPAAQATDVVIINGAGCQVTEEDAIGIFLHNDLYLRIDFPDSHWRFGLVNQGMKGLALVDVGVQALEFFHVEDSQGYTATDSELPIPNETTVDWNPLQFSSVMIQSATQTNDYGHLMGYEFLPGDRTGTGRFSQRTQDKEMWTQHDEYLTNDNPGEDGSGSGTNNWRYTWYSPDDYLLSYLNNQPIGGTGDGIVLWYMSSVHHEPTDADNQQGNGNRTGITLIHWAGFDMEPHNLFDYNPLGGPPNCGQ